MNQRQQKMNCYLLQAPPPVPHGALWDNYVQKVAIAADFISLANI